MTLEAARDVYIVSMAFRVNSLLFSLFFVQECSELLFSLLARVSG